MHHRHIKKDSGSGYQFNKASKDSPAQEDSQQYQSDVAEAAATDPGSSEPGLVGRLAGGVASAAASTASYGWGAVKWGASIGASATGAVASRLPVVSRFVGTAGSDPNTAAEGASSSRSGGAQDKKKE